MLKRVEQLKWLYSSLAGVCLVFFLTLLSSKQPATESLCLLISSIFFAIAFPIYVAFATAEISILEVQPSDKKIQSLLGQRWVVILTQFVNLALTVAFTFLAFHLSYWIGLFMLITGLIVLLALRKFILQLEGKKPI